MAAFRTCSPAARRTIRSSGRGGEEDVDASGLALNTTVRNGGIQSIGAHGFASDTLISSGGTEIIASGGTATDTTVRHGGHELAEAGGLVGGATLRGGEVELQSGATGAGTFTFASGGTLALDGTGTYGMLVAGFTSASAVIDATSVNFASATVSFNDTGGTTSGVLTVTDGTHFANVTLLGNYTAATFTSASDGHGGTVVSDPPPAADASANPISTPHPA